MPSLQVVVILALAAFRVTRLVTTDAITEFFRDGLFSFAWIDNGPSPATPRAAWRTWLWMLFTCDWCLGVWVSAGAYCAWRWGGDVALAVLVVAAVAGIQGSVAHFTERDD